MSLYKITFAFLLQKEKNNYKKKKTVVKTTCIASICPASGLMQ